MRLSNGKETYVKDYCKKTPSWDSLIKNLNHSVLNKKEIKNNHVGFFLSHEADLIPEVIQTKEKLEAESAHLYINFVCQSKTFGTHKDAMDVAYWQVKGITRWIVEDRMYLLKEGDLITVPKETYHSVTPITARAGISFGINL